MTVRNPLNWLYAQHPNIKSKITLGLIYIALTVLAHVWAIFQPVLVGFVGLIVAIVITQTVDRIPYTLNLSTGFSMLPTLPPGLDVTIQKDDPENIEVFDVVSYTKERPDASVNITHRVVEISEDNTYLMKGDNNEEVDGWIHQDEINGKLIQYNLQPIFLPLSPFGFLGTLVKVKHVLFRSHTRLLREFATPSSEEY